MQPLALESEVDVASFNTQVLGNISAHQGVPYLDVTATRDADARHLAIRLVNRHPRRLIKFRFRLGEFPELLPQNAWLLAAGQPQAENSFDAPEKVAVQKIEPPHMHTASFEISLKASSIAVLTFDRV